MKIIEKFGYIFSMILLGIIFFIVILYNKLAAMLALGFIIISLLIIKFLHIKINIPNILKKIFPVILFIFAFLLRYTCLNMLKIEPYSDFATLLYASQSLKDGINVMFGSFYFEMWGYQTGYILYQTLILKIFNSVQAIHILDCIFTSGICVLIYYIGKRVFNKGNIIPSILYTIYIFGIAYTGVLSNQHLYTLLSLIAIILITSKNEKIKFWKYPIVAVLLALANIIRPESIILICGIIGYEFFKITNKSDIKYFIRNILCVLIIYFTITQTTSIIIKNTGLNPSGLENKNTLWKFVCGFDLESNGGYSTRGEAVIGSVEQEKEFIKENLKSLTPYKLLILLKNKIEIFWANEAYTWVSMNWAEKTFTILNKQITGELLIKIINTIDKTFYVIMFVFALISIISNIKNNKNKERNLFIILLDLIAIAYLFIEVQPRYAYTAKVLIFILATDGINIINEKIKNKLVEENK